MNRLDNKVEGADAKLVRITIPKLLLLAVSGLLFPLSCVVRFEHFRPAEWGDMFWVVGGILWLIGILCAFTAYAAVVCGLRALRNVRT